MTHPPALFEPRVACAVGAELGEGPVWCAATASLWFTDIKRCAVLNFHPASGRLRSLAAPAQPGWVWPVADGSLLAGLQTGLHRVAPDSGRFTLLLAPEPERPGNRLNDATVDAQGRLWFGSMDDAEQAATGRFWRLQGGRLHATGLAPVPITNGPAVSPDGRTLYVTDTAGRRVQAVPIQADGSLGAPRPFVQLAEGEGWPDGPVVDSVGAVWTGVWGGFGLRRYSPEGVLLQQVRLPVANVTKLAFGGDDLCTAYVTTARKGLDAAALAAQPDAGHVFSFRVAVPGLPAPQLQPADLPAAPALSPPRA